MLPRNLTWNPIPPVINPCCNRVLFGVVPDLVKGMRRRDFINVVAGSAVTWPLRAHAQQPAKKMLRVGTVSSLQRSSSPTWAAFLRRLAELGY